MCISSGHKSTTAIPTDINECETGDSMCPELASCSNTVGSYECNCNTGYSDDGQQNCTGKNPIPQEIQALLTCMSLFQRVLHDYSIIIGVPLYLRYHSAS